MRAKTKTLFFKVTPTELEALEDLDRLGKFDSVSGAIRGGLGLLFDLHHLNWEFARKIEAERLIDRPRKGRVIPSKAPAEQPVQSA